MLTTAAKTYRNAFTGLSKETWLLSIIMLINRSGTMVIPFMTLYLTSPEMGYTVGQAGIVFGLFGAGAFSGAWLGGRLTDKIGFYPVQLFTLTGGGILFLVLGQMKTFPLICGFTYLLSFVNEAFRPANSTAIAQYSIEENRTRSYALNRLAINLGWAVGSGIGGYLANINYELLFWVDGITNISAALLLWLFLKPTSIQQSLKKSNNQGLQHSAYKDKPYMLFALLTALFASCFFQLFNNLPVFFQKEMQFSKPFIGIIMGANGIIIALLEMVLIYKLEGRRKNSNYIATGVFIVGLAFLMLNIPGANKAVAILMIIIVSLGEILALPFMNSWWINRSRPENRGQYAAIYTMAWSAAQTLGPMGGAQVAQHVGFFALWCIIGGICLFTSLAFNSLKKVE